MRDRLIEIIKKTVVPYFAEFIADDLIADGWMRPPCKVGQTIYRNIRDKTLKFKIVKIEDFGDKMLFIDDAGKWFGVIDIGTRVFLAKEEAEQALKVGVQE